MIQAIRFNSSSLLGPLEIKINDFVNRSRSSSRNGLITVVHCSSRSNSNIPKLEPFSRSRLDRALKEPSFIQKTETELADYCCTIEDGGECCDCWRAYFELKELEEKVPKRDLENRILIAGGQRSLIRSIHGAAAMYKEMEQREAAKHASADNTCAEARHIPDWLPKTLEELEEEEKAKMPDSPFTRLLRARGRYPAWYTPLPDHLTD